MYKKNAERFHFVDLSSHFCTYRQFLLMNSRLAQIFGYIFWCHREKTFATMKNKLKSHAEMCSNKNIVAQK